MINIIAVIGKNNAIGCNNKLLWDIPSDMSRFKALTMDHPVIMGRKTFESIGKALPGRCNIVITRNKDYKAEKCIVESSLKQSLERSKLCVGSDEVFIIGGGEIYAQALTCANRLYLTVVDDEPKADTFFPDYSEFSKIINEESFETDDIKYKFLELTK